MNIIDIIKVFIVGIGTLILVFLIFSLGSYLVGNSFGFYVGIFIILTIIAFASMVYDESKKNSA
jgi:hypothetical protein